MSMLLKQINSKRKQKRRNWIVATTYVFIEGFVHLELLQPAIVFQQQRCGAFLQRVHELQKTKVENQR